MEGEIYKDIENPVSVSECLLIRPLVVHDNKEKGKCSLSLLIF